VFWSDVSGEQCRGFIVVDKLLLLLQAVVFHRLTDAVAATTQRVVATTCHCVESARDKQSTTSGLRRAIGLVCVPRVRVHSNV